MVATTEFGDLHGHCWVMSHGKGHSLPFTRNAHTNPYAYISTLLFSKPLPGPRPFFYPAPYPHIQATPNGGTYLLLAPTELEGWWDKGLGTGQRWSFSPQDEEGSSSPPAPATAPGITHGPLGLGHGGFYEGPFDEDHNRDKEMPKASAQRKAGAQLRGWKVWASSEGVWECRLAGDEDPVDPQTSPSVGASQPLYGSRDLPPQWFCCLKGCPVFWNNPCVLLGGMGKAAGS